jgi:hypothetical protein
MKERVFHYTAYDRLRDWLALGWVIVMPNQITHHQHYGLVVEWLCDCKLARPR